jgi:predicted hydrocarbon binding protein
MTDLKSFLVKGSPMVADFELIRCLGGDDGLARFYRELPQQYADIIRAGIDPNLWYTMELRVSILEAVRKLYLPDDPQVFWEMGCYEAAHNIANFYRGFMEASSPDKIRELGKLYWRIIYASSSIELVSEEGHLEIEVFDYPQISVDNCHVIRGYIQGALEITGQGKRNLDGSETTCVNCGDERCRFVFDWA